MQTEASFIIPQRAVVTMDDANPRAAALAVPATASWPSGPKRRSTPMAAPTPM